MASQMVVPASKDTLFFRNFMSNQAKDDIREFFERESDSTIYVEFFKQSDIDGRLYIALRFQTKDIAKDVLNRFDGQEVLGDRVQISWFKDLRKAKQKHYNHRYGYHPGNQGPGGGRGWGSDPFYRERDWGDDYRRGGGGGDYDRDYDRGYRGSHRGRSRRDSSSDRRHYKSSSRSDSESRSRTPERRGRDSRSSSASPPKEKRRRSKSDKHEGTVKSTIREVSPHHKSDQGRSMSRDKDRKDDKDWPSEKQTERSNYSDYDPRAASVSPPPTRRRLSPSPDFAVNRNASPPQPHKFKIRNTAASGSYEPSADKYFRGDGEETEKRSVIIPKEEEFSRSEYRQRRSFSPSGSAPRRDHSPMESSSFGRPVSKQQELSEYSREDTSRPQRPRSPSPAEPRSRSKRGFDDEFRDVFREPMDTDESKLKPRKYPQDEWKESSRPDSMTINGGLNREMGRVDLPTHKMALLREKKDDIEKAYRNDCETFATVVKMLISKDVLLEEKLQSSLRENLKDIGQRCIYELREYIDLVRLDDH